MRRQDSRRLLIRGAGGILVGVACLWLSLRGVRGATVFDIIRQVSPAFILLAVLGVVLVAAGKALRWQWLFPPTASPPALPVTFGILMTGQMLNLLVPIRLGEVARIGLMRQEGVPVGTTVGTIVVEKALDLLAVALLFALAVPLVVLPGPPGNRAEVSGLVLALGLILALVLFGHFRVRLLALLKRIPAPAQPFAARVHRNLLHLAGATLESLAVLEGPHLLRVLGLTAIIWLLSVGGMLAMLGAFGLPLDVAVALVLMLAVTSANWAPTPPALIGVVGALAVAVLTPYGVPQETAVALGTVLNLVLVVPPVLLGGWAVWIRLVALREDMAHAGWRHALGLAHAGDEP